MEIFASRGYGAAYRSVSGHSGTDASAIDFYGIVERMGASESRNTPVANGIRDKYSFPSSPEIDSIDGQIHTIREEIKKYKSNGRDSSDLTARWSDLLKKKHALKAELRGAGYKRKSRHLKACSSRKRARTMRRRKGRRAQ